MEYTTKEKIEFLKSLVMPVIWMIIFASLFFVIFVK